MLTIVGAGSVGLVMGGRLAHSGTPILFVTRSTTSAGVIAASGVSIENPATGERIHARVDAVGGVASAGALIGDGPVMLCVRGSQVSGVADDLARAAPDVAIVCWQNDVGSEDDLARRFERVIGGVVRLTSTRTSASSAVAAGAGRLVLGDFPNAVGTETQSLETRSLAEKLRAAGYDVGVSERIGEDKWLKLCINLMSAPNALIRRADHATQTFVEVKARLLEEAKAAVEAAGIVTGSCDGRDRSLAEEIDFQRAATIRGDSARPLPIYNQVWSALTHGGPLEADGYHRRILELSAHHGLNAPQNEIVLAALVRAAEGGLGPESVGADELLAGV